MTSGLNFGWPQVQFIFFIYKQVLLAKTDYNVKELFSRVTALTYEVKLATEIEAKAEQARQFQDWWLFFKF